MKYNVRLAPSPTGLLHLGHAWTFFLSWLAARHGAGHVLLRFDDLDERRCRDEFVKAAIEDILWLGLDFDEIIHQSQRVPIYDEYFHYPAIQKNAYPCFCTRKELRELALAPHAPANVYEDRCRNLSENQSKALKEAGKPWAHRLIFPPAAINFTDLVYGSRSYAPGETGGDFPLRRSDGVLAYQFVTAIDDAVTEVNLVTRGNDLLSSTPRQLIIMDYLGLQRPEYAHFPLLADESGQRLAKRQESLALSHLRNNGVSSRTVIGWLASLAGLNPDGKAADPWEFVDAFSFKSLPLNDIRIGNHIFGKSCNI